jgi:hypothetical protein
LYRLRVLENRVLRVILGSEKDDVAREREEKTTYGETLLSVGLLLTKYYFGDNINQNEIGGACGTHEIQEKCAQGFGGNTKRKETVWKT